MGIVGWRRYHGREFIAIVMVKGPHAFAVAVCHEPSGLVRRLPTMRRDLESAKAAADDLVRKSFSHTCSLEFCGEWIIWSA
jgi:hypothetical protein